MRFFVTLALLLYFSFSGITHAQNIESTEGSSISAKQLVVMIDGRFPTTGAITQGAGIVVGKKGGLVYIATAGHVVQDFSEQAVDIKIQFQDRPGEEIDATLWPSNLDKGIDLALLVVSEDRAPKAITSVDEFSAARISEQVKSGEGAFLFGQPSGKVWSGNKNPEKVVSSTSTSIEVESNSVVPGMSGGATFDEGLRIIGLIIETDNGLARAIPIKLLKEILEKGGYPFHLSDTEGQLPNKDFDPLKELTARGYQLSTGVGFLGKSSGIDREFKRALTIGRKQDAELFVQARINLSIENIFEDVSVPEDIAIKIKKFGLHSSDTPAWCGGKPLNSEFKKIKYLGAVKKVVDQSNFYAIELFCSKGRENLSEFRKISYQKIEDQKKIANSGKSSKSNVVKECKAFFRERIPVAEIVESMLHARGKGGKQLKYDALFIRAQKDVEDFIARNGAVGIKIISGNRMSTFMPMKGFASIWQQFEREFWSLTGPTYLGNPQKIRSTNYAPQRGYIQRHLLPLIDLRCDRFISVIEIPIEATELEGLLKEIETAVGRF